MPHGRIPHNILGYKLGYNPNPRYHPKTDITEELQCRMQIRLDQTKKNIMQSYHRYKAYYDRKANTAPLETKLRNTAIFLIQKQIIKQQNFRSANSDGADRKQ